MLRVFLAEADPAVREMLNTALPWEHYGFRIVGQAGDGEMALPLIRQTLPDVLVTGLRMPIVDGPALCSLVSQELPKIKILLLADVEDFEYATTAVSGGVAGYLLKPVTIGAALPVLQNLQDSFKKMPVQQPFPAPHQQKTQAYEQYARRSFFEQLAAGQLSVPQIYENGKALDLDLSAQCYSVAFFTMVPLSHAGAPDAADPGNRIREGLLTHFLKYPQYILVQWSPTAYGVLIKSDTDTLSEDIRRCIHTVQTLYQTHGPELSWHVAVSTPTRRLSKLPECFAQTAKLWAYRYMYPQQHILTDQTVSFLTGTGSNDIPAALDARLVNPNTVTQLLRSGSAGDIPGFIDGYLRSVADALDSMPFCQYLMLSWRFAATEFLQTLDVPPGEFLQALNNLDLVGKNVTLEALRRYLTDVLLRALELRDKATPSQYRGVLKRAMDYIDDHYTDGELSLTQVAQAVSISPNHLSAVFRRETNSTFTEYVTGKRMDKAKELLRTTAMGSGAVALAAGYRDSRYFSALFKKTQGCSPREYLLKKDRK